MPTKKMRACLKKLSSLVNTPKITGASDAMFLHEIARWKSDRAEKKRYSYSLSKDSVVFDVGGYEGQFSSDVYSRYRSKIFIFEPVASYAKNISDRFSNNPDIAVYDYGLSGKTEETTIYINNNSSTLFSAGLPSEKAKMMKASDFLKANSIKTIDLMKINTEGGEYSLLEELIENDLIKNINNIQVQFHTFAPNAKERMEAIQRELSKTHHLTYQYVFVWENWERNAK